MGNVYLKNYGMSREMLWFIFDLYMFFTYGRIGNCQPVITSLNNAQFALKSVSLLDSKTQEQTTKSHTKVFTRAS